MQSQIVYRVREKKKYKQAAQLFGTDLYHSRFLAKPGTGLIQLEGATLTTMSHFTVQNIDSSLENRVTEIKHEKEKIVSNTKLAANDVKKLLVERKIISVSSSSAASLDSALCKDIITKHKNLQADIKKTIQKTKSCFSQFVKCARKQKAVALLDKKWYSQSSDLVALPPECVFVSEFIPSSRYRIHREQFEYVASCVRVGGEYAVAMRRRNSNNKDDEKDFVFDEKNDKIFPLESRDEFVIDRFYPLVGFEDDTNGNTHAVFMTGLALGVKSPKTVPTAEPNNGLRDIVIKGHRVAKVPVLCLFDTPDIIAATEFEEIFVPATQPMDECELNIITDQLRVQNSPEVEQKVHVYDSNARNTPLFSLTAAQVDELGNSWCNTNSTRCVKSGGFSGEQNKVDTREMNDLSCFSDCVDISVNMWEKFNFCVTIESGRRLFEASPTPFTRSDATKYATDSSSSGGDSSNDSSSFSSSSSIYTENDASEEVKVCYGERNTSQKRFCNYKITNSPQEAQVLEKLINWSEKSKFDNLREAEEEDWRNSWWCSYSPPLKIEEQADEQEVDTCVETEAAVKTADMIDRLTLEQEAVPTLYNAIYSQLERGKAKWQDYRCSKLKETLHELDKNVTLHSSIWSAESMATARALIIDEALASELAKTVSCCIATSRVFEGMGVPDTGKNSAHLYQGQRKYMSGPKMVNVSAMKQEGEREIDGALKEWIKSSLSFVKGEGKKRRAPPNAIEEEPPRKKSINEDKNGSPISSSSSLTTTKDHANDIVRIIPPSFVTMPPKINSEEFAENLADSFGRALCGMKNAADVYKNMCSAAAELRERLLTSPFKRFSACSELLDTVKAKDVERAAEEPAVSVLDYESKRLGKILTEAIDQKFSESLNKSCSWSMENKNDGCDNATKTAIIATNLRRTYEEYHAFKILANMFIFDKLRKELEGNTPCQNTSLAAAFEWYCQVVTRNRICDAFHLIVKPDFKSGNFFKDFYFNFFDNKIVVSLIINQIIDSLRWIMTTEIPSGYLKGLLDEAALVGSGRISPCDTIDETAKFVVPSMKIIGGESTSKMIKSVRIAPHIAGPIFVCVDFDDIGLDGVTQGKLFVNTVTGKGLLTVFPNPKNNTVCNDSIFSEVAREIVTHQKMFIHKKNLQTYSVAPSRIALRNGNQLFDARTFQNNYPTTNEAAPATLSHQTSWSDHFFEDHRNMWRCGFVLPQKLCDAVFDMRKSIKIKASPSIKSRPTNTVAQSCLNQNSKKMEKVCTALISLNKGRSSKILAENLAARSLTKIDVKICPREDSRKPIVALLMGHEECKQQFHSGVDNYSHAFFNFKHKSLQKCKGFNFPQRWNGKVKNRKEEKRNEIIDSLYILDVVQYLRRTLNRLYALEKKHVSNIATYSKKMGLNASGSSPPDGRDEIM